MGSESQRLNGFRHRVSRAHHVADTQPRRNLYIDLAGLKLGRAVLVVRPKARIADAQPASLVAVARNRRDGLKVVRPRTNFGRGDGEDQRLRVARAFEMKLDLRRIRAPSLGQLERNCPVGRSLRLHCNFDRQSGAIEGKNARLRIDAHANGRRNNKWLIKSAGAGSVLKRLNDLVPCEWERRQR